MVATISLGFARGLACLPLGMRRVVCQAVARVAFFAVPRVRRIGLANLDLAYGDTLSAHEKRRILKDACANVGIVLAEFTCIPELRADFFARHVSIKGIELVDRSRGGIFVGAHLGNWEWMAPTMASVGFEICGIVRPFDDPRLNAYIDGVRRSGGIRTIPKGSAWHEMVRSVKSGACVGILVDQSPRRNAAPGRFFGQPCWSTLAPALFGARTGAPVYPMSMIRDATGSYVFEVGAAIPLTFSGDANRDLIDNTQRCQDVIESLIRRAPGQWLWLHRRWRSRERLEEEWRQRKERH